MKGELVRDDGIVYEVIWTGEHNGQNADLFNPPADPEPEDHSKFQWKEPVDPRTQRERVVECLHEKAVWIRKDLEAAAGVTNPQLGVVLNSLWRSGYVQYPKRGLVELIKPVKVQQVLAMETAA